MVLANENYLKTPETSYIEEVEKRINAYRILHPNEKILRIGTTEAAQQMPAEVLAAMQKALSKRGESDFVASHKTVQGYDFLIEKILKEYRTCGVSLDKDSVFVNAGSISDFGNLTHILGADNIIAIPETVEPICLNTTVLSGRAGALNEDGKWSNLVYLPCNEDTNFVPQIPQEKVDVIFLSNPNNVTGTVIDRAALRLWVEYALDNQSLIVYDASFKNFIGTADFPKSIYEIRGAKRVAIEVYSFSRNTGLANLACGFSVFPPDLTGYTMLGDDISLAKAWSKYVLNYANSVSYIAQRGAEAMFSRKGKTEISDLVNYYKINASLIREELMSYGWQVFGGEESPFVWFKTPEENASWRYFQRLLYEHGIVGTPGIVFGAINDNYMRFSGICQRNDLMKALQKMRS